MPILLLIAEGGIEVNFLKCYAQTLNYFPFVHKTTAMKWCNLVSRGLSILAPMAAELPGQGPLVIMAVTLTSSLLTVQKLQEKVKASKKLMGSISSDSSIIISEQDDRSTQHTAL